MERIVLDVQELFKKAEMASDPRTQNWFLVGHISSPLLAICTYVSIVIFGQRIMKDRQCLNLRNAMAFYNFLEVVLNIYIFVKLLAMTSNANYSYRCEKVDNTPGNVNQLEIAKVIWWFYVSKYFELLDTVFFILRKKENQISFLHVYHHSSVVMIWWTGTKWLPGGSTFVAVAINSFVHIVMYTYYGLSVYPSLKKYLWWKKYLTQIQMIQFCSLIIHSAVILSSDCAYPHWMISICLVYSLSLFLLFGKFYLQAYIQTKLKKRL